MSFRSSRIVISEETRAGLAPLHELGLRRWRASDTSGGGRRPVEVAKLASVLHGWGANRLAINDATLGGTRRDEPEGI
jgi:hypothetical protein